ncbi:RNA 2',3'-cyclic phosphodiesterase [Candidatus Daviesbacteria bacterium]|nr:RNA 2',3'-cyclic phosphodiesterase [Candidatus Daviesbacteria bacterium]
MRFFIALEIPEESKRQLAEVQQQLQQIIPQARLTLAEKLHLTIAFIGEQPDELTGQLVELIKKAVTGISPFEVTPAYIDGFPKLHHPHTLWIGVKGDIDKLLLIRERIKDSLVNLKLAVDERRYTPHIAVAKINNNFNLDPSAEAKLQQLMTQKFQSIKITSIKLFESIPEGGLHRHNTLAQIPLNR